MPYVKFLRILGYFLSELVGKFSYTPTSPMPGLRTTYEWERYCAETIQAFVLNETRAGEKVIERVARYCAVLNDEFTVPMWEAWVMDMLALADWHDARPDPSAHYAHP